MNPIELNMMCGMTGILYDAAVTEPSILTKEQYDIRFADLKQLEEDTNFMLINSPNCDTSNIVVEIKDDFVYKYKKCNEAEDIVNFSNQKEMVALLNVDGIDVSITYTNGVITNINLVDEIEVTSIANMPYKIGNEGDYIVNGKIVFLEKPKLLVTDIQCEGSLLERLDIVERLGFEVMPHWSANNLNSDKFQSAVDYILDYATEELLHCNSVLFRFNNTEPPMVDGIIFENIY